MEKVSIQAGDATVGAGVTQVAEAEDQSAVNTTMSTTILSSVSPTKIPSTMPLTNSSWGDSSGAGILSTKAAPEKHVGLDIEKDRRGIMMGVLVVFIVMVISTIISIVYRLYKRRRLDLEQDRANTSASGLNKQLTTKISSTLQSTHAGGNASVAISVFDQNDDEAGTAMSTPERRSTTNNQSAQRETFSSIMATKGVFYPDGDMRSENNTDFEHSRQQDRDKGVPVNLMASINRWSKLSSRKILGDEGDEFDKYKDQLLEMLRHEVESTVDDVEGMLSLAITGVLLNSKSIHRLTDLSRVEGGDLGSIEASCLCQAFEWARREKGITEGVIFFKEMVDKVVSIVHCGLIHPKDGARILHGCALIAGMPLRKDLPNTTLVVQGLIKSNDLAKGQDLLMRAFQPFGDIVDASIAPQNRGFGFVRFVQPESVEAVLEQHQIEIQDVAVSVKTLKDISSAVRASQFR